MEDKLQKIEEYVADLTEYLKKKPMSCSRLVIAVRCMRNMLEAKLLQGRFYSKSDRQEKTVI